MAKTNGFVRSFISAVLAATLVACGGGGGGASGPGASKLFVLDTGNAAIGSMANSNPSAGTFTVDRIVSGSNTGFGIPGSVSINGGMALDAAADRLYVGTSNKALVFNPAGTANGNVAPARTFQATGSRNGTPSTIEFFRQFLDTANNRLYVADVAGRIFVLNNASSLSGNNTPTRSVYPDYGSTGLITRSLSVDTARNLIYIAMDGGIFVFNNADSINTADFTSTVPDRKLNFSQVYSMHLDSTHDRLYVALTSGTIQVFDNASGLPTGTTPPPNRTMVLNGVSNSIFVDTVNDRLYAVSGNKGYIVNGASTASTPVTATVVTVLSAGTQLSAVAVKP